LYQELKRGRNPLKKFQLLQQQAFAQKIVQRDLNQNKTYPYQHGYKNTIHWVFSNGFKYMNFVKNKSL